MHALFAVLLLSADAASVPPCAAPVLTAAEVGAGGEIRIAGLACSGGTVEIFAGRPSPATSDAPAGPQLQGFDSVATAAAAECGAFVVTIPSLPLDTEFVAVAKSSGGEASQPSAPRRLTLSEAPEAVVETPEGTFVIRLLTDVAPQHVKHFIETAIAGGFDGTVFHRGIPGDLIQGGDPLSRDPKKSKRYGSGGLGLLKAEFSDRCFSRGVVGAVRCPSNCDSGGNQFFISLTDHPELTRQYTAFGEVLSGLDAVEKISRAAADGQPRIPMKVTIRQPKRF